MGQRVVHSIDSPSVIHLCEQDSRICEVIDLLGPLVYELHDEDPYEFLVHEIIEQMLSVKAGERIFHRLSTMCNGKVDPQKISRMSVEQIKSAGMSKAKTEYIMSLTESVNRGSLAFDSLYNMSDEKVITKLTSIRGIGNWTAKMYLIFVLGRENILPFEDGAFQQAYRLLYRNEAVTSGNIQEKGEKWSPYCSIAARYLYRALDTGIAKQLSEK